MSEELLMRETFDKIKDALQNGESIRAYEIFTDQAWFRRPTPYPILQCGNIEIATDTKTVKIKGIEVGFTKMEFKLLKYMMHHKGVIRSSKQILVDVWGPAHADDVQYLRVYISQIRRKLADDGDTPKIIITSPAFGYMMQDPATAGRMAA